jgi:hypothetical protein
LIAEHNSEQRREADAEQNRAVALPVGSQQQVSAAKDEKEHKNRIKKEFEQVTRAANLRPKRHFRFPVTTIPSKRP